MEIVMSGQQVLGLRERGKRERLSRLHQAAATVFRTVGYDNATTREIAQMAEVSVGTLFTYAKDKRDLLLLVINDDLDECLQGAVAQIAEQSDLIERLVELLSPIYTYFASEPELARPVLREVAYFDRPAGAMGGQFRRYLERLDAWQDVIAEILVQGEVNGQIHMDVPAALLARILFDIHMVEVRRWMAANVPAPEQGKATLRAMFKAVLGSRVHSPG
jgi:AcrR family transcriptional regulator